jgi:hypothetical protein
MCLLLVITIDLAEDDQFVSRKTFLLGESLFNTGLKHSRNVFNPAGLIQLLGFPELEGTILLLGMGFCQQQEGEERDDVLKVSHGRLGFTRYFKVLMLVQDSHLISGFVYIFRFS